MSAIATPAQTSVPRLPEAPPPVFVSSSAQPVYPVLAALLRAAPRCGWKLFRVAPRNAQEQAIETLVIGDLAWQAQADRVDSGRWDEATQRVLLGNGQPMTLWGDRQEPRRPLSKFRPMSDKRQDPRVRGVMSVRISGSLPESAVTQDISRTGAFIRTGTPRSVGSKLALRIVSRHLPAPLVFAAEVVRVEHGRNPGMGVRFVFGEAVQKAAIDSLIERLAIAA
jgi:hypothetical protein